MFDDFKTKELYKKSKQLYSLIQDTLDKDIPYFLRDQISRASLSIILNFSEGYGRWHKNDKKQFYITARASLNETVTCFDILKIHANIDRNIEEEFETLSKEIAKMISGLINSMK